jgi:hypothetical protein
MLSQGPAAAILGGWQVSGILQLQSGFPYTIDYTGDPINIGGGSGGILVRPTMYWGQTVASRFDSEALQEDPFDRVKRSGDGSAGRFSTWPIIRIST